MVLFTEGPNSHASIKHQNICSPDPKEQLADGYYPWANSPPITPRSIKSPQLPFTHFAMIAIDGKGCVQYHTSQSLERHSRFIFSPDVKDRFLQATGKVSRSRLEAPSKKRRLEPEVIVPDVTLEAVDRLALKIGDTERLIDYYEQALRAFQQINCRQVAKAFIKIIEPRKQVKHPYNGGRGATGEKGDPEKTKPDWWPAGVIHREPDHLKKPERIRLLVHIIRNLRQSHGITTEKLEEAGRDVKRQIKPRERWDILEEIYAVRKVEESYERNEIDADAIVYVVNRESSSKSERDSECLSDSGQTCVPDVYSRSFPDFAPSPVEQISTPVTTDAWTMQQSIFHPIGYANAQAPLSIQPPQAPPPPPMTQMTSASEMHLGLGTVGSQFEYLPLGAPPFPSTGGLGHPHLVHQGDETIPRYR